MEDKRAELAALPAERLLSDEELDEIRAIGDNTGCMALKGGSPDHEGESRADRWSITPSSHDVAARWEIEPERDLQPAASAALAPQLAPSPVLSRTCG